MVKQFKNTTDNLLHDYDDQSTDITTVSGTKILLTCDPVTISNTFQSSIFTRSAPARRMASYLGLKQSIISQPDDLSTIKREELKKYLTTQSYEDCLNESLAECMLILNVADGRYIDLFALVKRSLTIGFLEHVLGVNIKNTVMAEEISAGILLIDRLDEYPRKLALLNAVPLPLFVKNLVSPRMKQTNQIFEKLTNTLYNHAEAKPNSWFLKIKKMEQDQIITHVQALGELRSIFFAANTLTISIIWTLYGLSVEDPTHITRTVADIDYARYCFMEMLRLQPPVNIMAYEEKSKCPFHFKKQIVVSIFDTHRSPKNWDRPLEFIPDRFSQGLKNIPKGAFLPFGGGDRRCPGLPMSMNIGPRFIQSIFKKYRFYDISNENIHRLDENIHPGLPADRLMGIIRTPQKNQLVVKVSKV
jgi:cytochrome P450